MSANTEHEEPSSFIKTPEQLITVVVLAFVVPVIGILLLVSLVLGGQKPDPAALEPTVVAARIQPVGKVEVGAGSGAAKVLRSGEQIVTAACAACHNAGVAGAAKIGDKAAWGKLIPRGLDKLTQSAIAGVRGMPARGGNPDLSDLEIARAIVYMVNQSGGNFKEPAAPKESTPAPAAPAAAAAPASAPAPAANAKAAAVDGKKVYDSACLACHVAGVAGAPKLGDKAAWAPRVKTGIDALVASVTKGKGAMPANGGNPALSNAEIRAAVEYMIGTVK